MIGVNFESDRSIALFDLLLVEGNRDLIGDTKFKRSRCAGPATENGSVTNCECP